MSLENDGNIKIGMSVSCVINIDELTDVLAVPINSVQINGETKEVDITTGISNDEYVQVLSGLQGGETIQVVTTTKQNTIRSDGGNGSGFGGGMDFGGGSMPNFSGGSMPDFSGGMPSGGSRPSGRQGQ